MIRRGDLPAALHHVHPRFGSPSRAVLAVGIAATLVAAWGTLQAVATAASCAILIYYGITNAAALRLPAADRLYPRFVPAFGLAACATLALALPPSTVLFTLGLLAVAILIRAARSAALRRPRGP